MQSMRPDQANFNEVIFWSFFKMWNIRKFGTNSPSASSEAGLDLDRYNVRHNAIVRRRCEVGGYRFTDLPMMTW
jgi:hypothetical protein